MENKGNVIVRPYRPGEERYVSEAHEHVYIDEQGWSEIFREYVWAIPREFAARPKNPREELWIAELDGRPVGSIMLLETENPDVAHLRVYLVEKQARGHGVGKALLSAFMQKARDCGYKKIVLGTTETQKTARSQYAGMGFRMTGRKENREWLKDGALLWEEDWELEL